MNDIIYAGKHLLTMAVSRHAHNTWELIYCTSGEGEFIFDEFTLPYGKGDVVVIPPYVPHSNNSTAGFTNIFLNLSDSTLTMKAPAVIADDSNGFIYNAFSAAFFHFSEGAELRHTLLSAYGNLIAGYMSAYHHADAHSEIVEQIERSIIENYSDCNYELDEYLRTLPFSYDYLRKLFKKELGVTPHKYLCDKRLQTAADWLCSMYHESNNVTEISHLCGFREPLYFSRMFKKKYGVAPSYYLSARRQEEERAGSLSPDNVKIKLD